MVCRNCGNEKGTRYDCLACGYDPTQDDPSLKVRTQMPVELPPVEIVLLKRSNLPAIFGLVFAILMWIPIPFIGWITSPICYITSLLLTFWGFFRIKKCRSGAALSIISLIICVLMTLFVVGLIVLIIALGGYTAMVDYFSTYEFSEILKTLGESINT